MQLYLSYHLISVPWSTFHSEKWYPRFPVRLQKLTSPLRTECAAFRDSTTLSHSGTCVILYVKEVLFISINIYVYRLVYTICPGSSDPFYIVSYYIRWVTTSWTHSNSGQEFLDSQFPIIAILNSACSNLFDLTRNYIGPKLSTKARTKQTNQR